MAVYLVGYAGIGITALITGQVASKTNKKTFLITAFCIMVLIAGFRSQNVGADTPSYLAIFDFLQNNSIGEAKAVFTTIETGYLVFVKCLTFFTNSKQVFLIVQAIVIYFSIGRFILRYSDDAYIATLFFYALSFTTTMNIMRQWIALSILLFTFEFLDKKKYFNVICLLMLAITFHKSAIVFGAVIVAYTLKEKKRFSICCAIAGIAMCLVLNSSAFDNILVAVGYSRIVNSRWMEGAQSNGTMAYIYFLICALDLIVIALTKKREVANGKAFPVTQYRFCQKKFYLLMSILGAYTNYLARINAAMSRFGLYFLVFMFFVFSDAIERICRLVGMRWRILFNYIVYVLLAFACMISAGGYRYEFLIK